MSWLGNPKHSLSGGPHFAADGSGRRRRSDSSLGQSFNASQPPYDLGSLPYHSLPPLAPPLVTYPVPEHFVPSLKRPARSQAGRATSRRAVSKLSETIEEESHHSAEAQDGPDAAFSGGDMKELRRQQNRTSQRKLRNRKQAELDELTATLAEKTAQVEALEQENTRLRQLKATLEAQDRARSSALPLPLPPIETRQFEMVSSIFNNPETPLHSAESSSAESSFSWQTEGSLHTPTSFHPVSSGAPPDSSKGNSSHEGLQGRFDASR